MDTFDGFTPPASGGAIAAPIASDDRQDLLRVITCGSVDDGKSTLIGRLLHDAGAVSDDQLAALREMSCPAGQGYYLSRPLPAAGVERLLAECAGDGGLVLPAFRLDRAG